MELGVFSLPALLAFCFFCDGLVSMDISNESSEIAIELLPS